MAPEQIDYNLFLRDPDYLIKIVYSTEATVAVLNYLIRILERMSENAVELKKDPDTLQLIITFLRFRIRELEGKDLTNPSDLTTSFEANERYLTTVLHQTSSRKYHTYVSRASSKLTPPVPVVSDRYSLLFIIFFKDTFKLNLLFSKNMCLTIYK